MCSQHYTDLSYQQDDNDPNSFFLFIANAENGRNSGLELEQTYYYGLMLLTLSPPVERFEQTI